jgi:hypothetical protein
MLSAKHGELAMPNYQNPRAEALHQEALALYAEAERATTGAERERLTALAEAKVREADKAEH